MARILSQSGDSLADIYDVRGSIAGIDELVSKEVSLVHEMGDTIFAERISTEFRRSTSGAVLQNVDIDMSIPLPVTPTRLLGVVLFTDNAARILQAVVSVRDPVVGQDMPIWIWDGTTSEVVRMVDDGGGAGDQTVLIGHPSSALLPNMVGGATNRHPGIVNGITTRAVTTGFGAGNVTLNALYYIAFATLPGSGISSRGLPVPSW